MFNWSEYHSLPKTNLASRVAHRDPGHDEFLFLGELKDQVEPALPSTTAEPNEDWQDQRTETGDPKPSQHWEENHNADASNPAETGPAGFSKPLDPNTLNDPRDSGAGAALGSDDWPDEQLLAPGPALSDRAPVMETWASCDWLMGNNTAHDDISKAAKQFLKTGHVFTAEEQHELINEGEGEEPSSLVASLDLEGTHYAALEKALQSKDFESQDEYWML